MAKNKSKLEEVMDTIEEVVSDAVEAVEEVASEVVEVVEDVKEEVVEAVKEVAAFVSDITEGAEVEIYGFYVRAINGLRAKVLEVATDGQVTVQFVDGNKAIFKAENLLKV